MISPAPPAAAVLSPDHSSGHAMDVSPAPHGQTATQAAAHNARQQDIVGYQLAYNPEEMPKGGSGRTPEQEQKLKWIREGYQAAVAALNRCRSEMSDHLAACSLCLMLAYTRTSEQLSGNESSTTACISPQSLLKPLLHACTFTHCTFMPPMARQPHVSDQGSACPDQKVCIQT